ncbi:MAG: hypothetical protein KGL69_08155 [Alphaproteobacteria bacterium]|nr:hypothetical protein [Alphaproteobacteria bacterium]
MTRLGLTGLERGAAALVAGLLLLLQAAIPPGFMLASGGATPTGAPSIVICTGHGPLSYAPDAPNPHRKTPRPSPSQTCPFAGHAGASLVPDLPAPQPITFARFAPLTPDGHCLAPGRGLAAPPPPATGPPSLLT